MDRNAFEQETYSAWAIRMHYAGSDMAWLMGVGYIDTFIIRKDTPACLMGCNTALFRTRREAREHAARCHNMRGDSYTPVRVTVNITPGD